MNNFLGEIIEHEDGSVTATFEIVPGFKIGAMSPVGDREDAMREANKAAARFQRLEKKYGLGAAIFGSALTERGQEILDED